MGLGCGGNRQALCRLSGVASPIKLAKARGSTKKIRLGINDSRRGKRNGKYFVRKRMLGCAVTFCTSKRRGETLTGIEDRPFRLAGLGMRESFACDDGIEMPLRGFEIRLEVEALALGGKKSEGLGERLTIAKKREQAKGETEGA